MKTILLIQILLIFSFNAYTQTLITGTILNKKGETLPGVNVYLKGSYDGASSNAQGTFSFKTNQTGNQELIASYIGHQNSTQTIHLADTVNLIIVLKENINSIDAVTITAGTFAASDEKRAAILKPLDIYTTASANGDIMAAMQTMPGTQVNSDDGRLLVRGGDVYESKTFIDGLLTSSPYYSKTPDLPTRGRFSPSMFSGVQFSTGGYSAEYGQALSSVLELNSTDAASSDNFGLSIMSIGGEINYTNAFKKGSFGVSGSYSNMGIYKSFSKSDIKWIDPVKSVNINANLKYKPNTSSSLKVFIRSDYRNLSYQSLENNFQQTNLQTNGNNKYANISYKGCISSSTCFKIGVSSSTDNNSILINDTKILQEEKNTEAKLTLTHFISDGISIKAGVGDTYSLFNENLSFQKNDQVYEKNLNKHLFHSFLQSEIKLSKYIALRPGLRYEYSTFLAAHNVAPRFALALKTGRNSQLSAAYGKYYQSPQMQYLKYQSNLNFEEATHLIGSFQAGHANERLFRTEIYSKKYNSLITWQGINTYFPKNINNDGYGYAQGLDLFWKDKKSIKNFEYWMTYSFIDTKRKYKNYPKSITPEFVSQHNFSLVSKYWINAISTQIGSTLSIASPRTYFNSFSSSNESVTTKTYSNLSINMSKVFYLGDQYSVFYVSVSNVLGNNNILAYRASTLPNNKGNYQLTPVKRDMKRFVFAGLFLNF